MSSMPLSIPIDLPKMVAGETLEQVCIKAAEEMGYKTKSRDEFSKGYSLGSVHEYMNYDRTNIRVGNFLPILHVRGIEKGRKQKRFFIWTGLPFGVASKRTIEQYLSTVSKYL